MGSLNNTKHEKFAQAVVKGLSAEDAYKEAGYKSNRHNASRLNTKDHIIDRVAELTPNGTQSIKPEMSRVFEELARLGFSDARKLFCPTGELLPIMDLDDATAAAIESIEVTTRQVSDDRDGERKVEYTHKVKLWNKNTALGKLAKNLSLYAQDKAIEAEEKSIRDFLDAIKGAQAVPVATREADD